MSKLVEYLTPKYKYLVRVPGTNHAQFALLASGLFYGLLCWVQGHDLAFALVMGLIGLALIPLGADFGIKRSPPLKPVRRITMRRLSALTLFETYIILIGAVLDFFVSQTNTLKPAFSLMTLSISSYIRVTVVSSFTTAQHLKTASVSLVTPMLRAFSISLIPLSNHLTLTGSLLGVASGGLLGLLFVAIALRPMKERISPLRIASAFVADLLDGDAKAFEDALKPICGKKDGWTDVIYAKRSDDGLQIALIVPSFHPGPYRNVGSSMLPYVLERTLNRRRIRGIFLKGCSSHESNVISREEIFRLAEQVERAIIDQSTNGFTGYCALAEQVEVDGVKLSMIKFGDRVLAIPTLHPSPMEDFPEEVAELGRDSGLIVVDSHNSFMEGFKYLSDEDVGRIREALTNYGSGVRWFKGVLRIGVERRILPDYGLSDGVGPNGFTLVGFEVNGHRFALAVADANNALPEVRSQVIKRLKEKGWDGAEFVTTDTHIVNGVKLGGIGYVPLGKKIDSREISRVYEGLSDAIFDDLRPAEVKCIRVEHKGVDVFSSDTLESLTGRARFYIWFYFVMLGVSTLLGLITASW